MPYKYIQTLYFRAWKDALMKAEKAKNNEVSGEDVKEAMEEIVDG